MCNSIVKILTMYLIQQSGAFHFVGNYHYLEFRSFIRGVNRCGFIPWNISSNIKKEYSKTEEFCMVFMESVKNIYAKSHISHVYVKYLDFGVQYNFEVDQFRCASDLDVQNVDIMLICLGKTVLKGRMCKSNEDCDRNMEECQRHRDIDLHICIPKRHLHESCDEYAKCDKNSECMSSGNETTCQCPYGYEEMDGHCIEAGLFLGDVCSKSSQCSGTKHATECLYNQTKQNKVCSCKKGYVSGGSKCIVAGLVLGENCYVDAQCTGTPNSGVCMTDHRDNETQICQCASAFIRYNDRCLQVNRHLYEDCEIDNQCNGTSNEEALACRKIRHRNLCMCNAEYVVDEEYLKCRKAKKEINNKCRINEQCTGTENANRCVTKGKDENEGGVCRCNDQYDWIIGQCLKIGMKLFEPCVNNKQCNGTENAENCTEIGNNTLCYCQDEFLDFKGKCIKGYKFIDEECEANIQCTGTEHASVCGEYQTCSCDNGFIRLEEGCVPAKEKLPSGWLSENRQILIAVGGWFGGIAFSVITLFCALKRRKSKTTRIESRNSSHLPIRTINYSVADNTMFGNTDHAEGGVNQQSYIYDQAENIDIYNAHQMDQQQETENVYDDAYQMDQDEETVNVYSFSEPQCYQREQDSDNDTYNHLHQRPLQMSDDVYGVPKTMSIPL